MDSTVATLGFQIFSCINKVNEYINQSDEKIKELKIQKENARTDDEVVELRERIELLNRLQGKALEELDSLCKSVSIKLDCTTKFLNELIDDLGEKPRNLESTNGSIDEPGSYSSADSCGFKNKEDVDPVDNADDIVIYLEGMGEEFKSTDDKFNSSESCGSTDPALEEKMNELVGEFKKKLNKGNLSEAMKGLKKSNKGLKAAAKMTKELSGLLVDFVFVMSQSEQFLGKYVTLDSVLKNLSEEGESLTLVSKIVRVLEMTDREVKNPKGSNQLYCGEIKKNMLDVDGLILQLVKGILDLELIVNDHERLSSKKMSLGEAIQLEKNITTCEKELEGIEKVVTEVKAAFASTQIQDLNLSERWLRANKLKLEINGMWNQAGD